MPSPGVAAREKLRHAIQIANLSNWREERKFTCMGWREVDGAPVYLHGRGSIPNEKALVELSKGLERYGLPESAGDVQEAIRASASVFDTFQFTVAAPLMSAVYLAPLIDAAERAGERITLLLYLFGRTGSKKSTAAGLILSHFGIFTGDTLPASLRDTANTLGEKAFLAKDSLFVIDDMLPPSSKRAGQVQNDAVEAVIKSMADGHNRGRMRADGTLRPQRRTRCLTIFTGEMLPSLSESDLARLFPVEMNAGSTHLNALSQAQAAAQEGALARAMRAYVEWLYPQYGELPEIIGERFRTYRAEYQGTGHPRQAGELAWLRIGFEFMTAFWSAQGYAFDRTGEALEVFKAHAVRHAQTLAGNEPLDLFFTALQELVDSNQATIADSTKGRSIAPDLIGYQDGQYVYLMPGPMYAKVTRHYDCQGSTFPLTARELERRLHEAGYLHTRPGKTRLQKKIGGQPVWFMWLHRDRFDERRDGMVI